MIYGTPSCQLTTLIPMHIVSMNAHECRASESERKMKDAASDITKWHQRDGMDAIMEPSKCNVMSRCSLLQLPTQATQLRDERACLGVVRTLRTHAHPRDLPCGWCFFVFPRPVLRCTIAEPLWQGDLSKNVNSPSGLMRSTNN